MASARGILTIQSLKNELIEGSRHVASSSASITPAMRNRNICVGGVDLILESLRQIIIVDAG